jgi:uncharacterized membrane protein YeaQ/YmgE (transglycosylase-associated protein family)
MAILEVLLWVLMGLVMGGLAAVLPGARSFWLVAGSGLCAWLGGTAGKFVFHAPTTVAAEFSWVSLPLAAAGALVFIWYMKVIAPPREHH